MSRVLWIGDAGTPTGFGRVAHAIGERLVYEHGHELHVLAVGFKGREPVFTNMHLYGTGEGQPNGFDRLPELLDRLEPEVVITCEDIPFVINRLARNPWDSGKKLATGPWRRLSYFPVDGTNLPPIWQNVKEYVDPVAMTQFGADVFGMKRVIYHGVDSDVFYPVWEKPLETSFGTLKSKADCREAFGVPLDRLIVGRVDTNSGRKDWPSQWRIMDRVNRVLGEDNIQSIWHTKLQEVNGTNLRSLLTRGEIGVYMVTDAFGWPVEDLVALYNCFDVFMTTTRGEGFGLTIAEALACGVPVLGPDHTSLPEVVGPGGVLVPPARVFTSPYGHDLELVDIDAMSEQLIWLLQNEEKRESLGKAGLEHVRAKFSWDDAARSFHELIEEGESRGAMGSLEAAVAG